MNSYSGPGYRESLCLAVLALVFASGCATYADRLMVVRNEFANGDLTAATADIEKGIARRGKEVEVFKLERSIVELAAGKPKEAERTLREVRDRFDHLEQAAVGENALAMLTENTRR